MSIGFHRQWKQGYRPQGFADHTNEMIATRKHLADMWALVFKQQVPEPKP